MKHKKGIVFITLMILSGQALTANDAMKGNNSYWLCKAYDSDNNQWIAKSPYKRMALNSAYGDCKKESNVPQSCQAANEHCEDIIKGVVNHPKWQCTALDQMANTWVGDTYTSRDQAVTGAKAYCEKHSAMPDSCYVNLLTCKNLQAQT